VPHEAEDYVHRIGRTARANTSGVAITLINDRELRRFKDIERLIENEVIKLACPLMQKESPSKSHKKYSHQKK